MNKVSISENFAHKFKGECFVSKNNVKFIKLYVLEKWILSVTANVAVSLISYSGI
jgi:hypothetical protein